MTGIERTILSMIADRCNQCGRHISQTELVNAMPGTATVHAINSLLIMGMAELAPRRPHGPRRYVVTVAGYDALKVRA